MSWERGAGPTVLLVMQEGMNGLRVTNRHRRALSSVANLLHPHPVLDLSSPPARQLLPKAEVLLTSWGCPPIDESVLDRAPELAAVLHAAGTVRNHVTDACWRRGVTVTSAAVANAVPVAEFTMAAIVLANKGAFELQRRYQRTHRLPGGGQHLERWGNYRRTVGVVGASRVGRHLIRLLSAFDLDICLYDPYVGAQEAATMGVDLLELDTLMRRSDVVTIHAPLLSETRDLLDRRRLALLPDGALVVNTARGAIINQAALERELSTGRLSAIIDTTDPEPLPASSPLYDLPNVFLTPHIAGAVGYETGRLLDAAIEELGRLARGEPLQHRVTRTDLDVRA